MDRLEPVEQGIENAFDGRLRQRPVALEPLLERLTVQQRHHHVGGAVGLEKIEDADDRRRAVEPGEDTRLLEEAIAPPMEFLGQSGRPRQHRGAIFADRDRRRQIFLDRDISAERRIARPVGDAEATVAEDSEDFVAAQPHTRGQCAPQILAYCNRRFGSGLGHCGILPWSSRRWEQPGLAGR